MKEFTFKSKVDGKELRLKVPTTAEEIENNNFIEIDGKLGLNEEVIDSRRDISSLLLEGKGEPVFSISEIYDLYYHKGKIYCFYWDTASGCIFSVF